MSAAVEPAAIIEVDVGKRTPKKKPAVQERLENSPKKMTTPDIIQAKLAGAEERRKKIEADKIDKAHQSTVKRSLFGSNKENTPEDKESEEIKKIE